MRGMDMSIIDLLVIGWPLAVAVIAAYVLEWIFIKKGWIKK